VIKSLRARLTVWYVSILGVVLVGVSLMIHVLLRRELHDRIDENLRAVTGIAVTSLDNDLEEGQSVVGAAQSTSAELHSNQAMLAIYDGAGNLLAEAGRDDELHLVLPPRESIPDMAPEFYTATESDDDDRHRIAVRRAVVGPTRTEYIVVAGTDLEATEEELASLRSILFSVVPTALLIAAIVGWFLARHSLSPVMIMAQRARRIGFENPGGRLPVVNPDDELGRLAETFNELLARLESSFAQQRQFMADASHELRTPVATTRTAVAVALQARHREEDDYRETLQIIEHQTDRLARLVDDMFTLARADAGNYPVQRSPMYLDELVEEVARATRVLANHKGVSIHVIADDSAAFTGDEDLIRRMLVNLLDNAIRHAPPDSTVAVSLQRGVQAYEIEVTDQGSGIPVEARPHIFERFYRSEVARGRDPTNTGGAGLGLAIAKWIARLHDGDIALVTPSASGTTFRILLPIAQAVSRQVPAATV
jgi:two-component system OmpR family sensor kinase